MKQSKKAFTLVELAIVLVIIGILLGAIIKSQGLIENSKTKKTIEEIQNLKTAVALYYDNYNYLPGDDPKAIDTLDATYNGNGDNVIGGLNINCSTATNESCAAWEDLRLAGFIKGSGVSNPKDSFGNQIAIGNYGGINIIELRNIPKRIAVAIDTKLDDGNTSSGDIYYRFYNSNTDNTLDIKLNLPK